MVGFTVTCQATLTGKSRASVFQSQWPCCHSVSHESEAQPGPGPECAADDKRLRAGSYELKKLTASMAQMVFSNMDEFIARYGTDAERKSVKYRHDTGQANKDPGTNPSAVPPQKVVEPKQSH